MKLTLMGLVLGLSLLWSCGPKTYTSTSENAAYAVPASVQTNFNAQYPNATQIVWSPYDVTLIPIDWEMAGWAVLDKDDYAVSYMFDGQKYVSWYDSDGTWIGSSYVITDHTILPSAVHTMIGQKYPGYTIDKVDKEMWKDMVAYEVKLKSGDNKIKLLVDANGNVIKEKVK
jgi:hypothetical protein